MSKYYFNKTLYEKAIELLNKSKDLADIANDVFSIDKVIANSYLYTYMQLREMDESIKCKYPEIKLFQELANSIKWINAVSFGYSQPTTEEVEALKFDLYYLLALALKKSGEIVELSDFFDKAYIANE